MTDEVFWRKNGTSFPVEYVSTPILEQDKIVGAVVTFKDITERKWAEKERQRLFAESQRNLDLVRALHEIDLAISSTLDLRTVLDILMEKVDTFLSYPTVSTIRLLNKGTGELEATACQNLNEVEWKSEERKVRSGLPHIVLETKAPLTVINVQKDPRTRDRQFFQNYGLLSYLGVPLIAKDEVLGVFGFFTKEERQFSNEEIEFLTALAGQAAIAIHNSQLYEETKNQAIELERSNKVKDEFLSVMSHELRTPLTAVTGYTGMIVDGMLGEINPEQEKALGKVMRRCNDLLGMINGILYATSLEAGAVKADIHEVSLGNFFDKLRSDLDAPITKELTFTWDYPSNLPVIRTDSEKLKHILQNLINNAIKFTERGNVTVSAREIERSRQVEFKVADTGVGIPKEHLSVIFERFRQVDSSETRLFGGVGMGLYIVKQFTEMLGGTIEVESEPGKGSTFTVTIPHSPIASY